MNFEQTQGKTFDRQLVSWNIRTLRTNMYSYLINGVMTAFVCCVETVLGLEILQSLVSTRSETGYFSVIGLLIIVVTLPVIAYVSSVALRRYKELRKEISKREKAKGATQNSIDGMK